MTVTMMNLLLQESFATTTSRERRRPLRERSQRELLQIKDETNASKIRSTCSSDVNRNKWNVTPIMNGYFMSLGYGKRRIRQKILKQLVRTIILLFLLLPNFVLCQKAVVTIDKVLFHWKDTRTGVRRQYIDYDAPWELPTTTTNTTANAPPIRQLFAEPGLKSITIDAYDINGILMKSQLLQFNVGAIVPSNNNTTNNNNTASDDDTAMNDDDNLNTDDNNNENGTDDGPIDDKDNDDINDKNCSNLIISTQDYWRPSFLGGKVNVTRSTTTTNYTVRYSPLFTSIPKRGSLYYPTSGVNTGCLTKQKVWQISAQVRLVQYSPTFPFQEMAGGVGCALPSSSSRQGRFPTSSSLSSSLSSTTTNGSLKESLTPCPSIKLRIKDKSGTILVNTTATMFDRNTSTTIPQWNRNSYNLLKSTFLIPSPSSSSSSYFFRQQRPWDGTIGTVDIEFTGGYHTLMITNFQIIPIVL